MEEIKILRAAYTKAVKAVEAAQKKLSIASSTMEDARTSLMSKISEEYSNLLEYVPSEIEFKPVLDLASETPTRVWTRLEIVDLLEISFEEITRHWPNNTNIATTQELNQVLRSLGRRPLEDYL